MLDKITIDIIKATVPVVKANADKITNTFYPLLFDQYPEVIPYFNQTHQALGAQPKALANAVVAYASNIDQLGRLSDAVNKIVQKHCALGIQAAHYPMVGDCLLQAIKIVLGDIASDDIISAWGKAYGQLAKILMDAEASIYEENAQKVGGWSGEREFTLVSRVQESEMITSFYFEPLDGGAIPHFEPGQYLTIIVEIKGKSIRRNYSLSDAPGNDYFRISVKRENNGLVSGFLHNNLTTTNTVKILPPAGHFVLRKNEKPVLLVTGGVGITPAISMINTVVKSDREVRFIHAALNSKVHAFKKHVDHLVSNNSNMHSLYIYSQPTAECKPNAVGFITEEILASQLPEDRDVELYFLGPKPFMNAVYKMAHKLNIPETQIHYEFFGPEEQLTN